MSGPAEPAPAATPPGRGTSGYRLVIFDFDGTLADTYDWFAATINEVADRYDFRRVEAHEVDSVRRMSAREAIRYVGIPAWKLPFISRHMRALATRDVDAVRLFPGVEAMLVELDRHGILLAAVSSNSEANIRHALGVLSLRFRRFACGAALFRKARRLRKVMRLCGVPPEATLAVGDELRDLDAARKAGCAFGAVAWGYTHPDALAARGPDHLFGSPAEIAGLLLAQSR